MIAAGRRRRPVPGTDAHTAAASRPSTIRARARDQERTDQYPVVAAQREAVEDVPAESTEVDVAATVAVAITCSVALRNPPEDQRQRVGDLHAQQHLRVVIPIASAASTTCRSTFATPA